MSNSIDSLIDLFSSRISGARAKEYVLPIWENQRWSSADRDAVAVDWYAEQMERLGLSRVERFLTPADGRTSFGGIVTPRLWYVRKAILKVVSPVEMEIADYTKTPCNLMMYSHATPPGGEIITITREGAVSDEGVLFGEIGDKDGNDVTCTGEARILISDYKIQCDDPRAKDAVMWHNFTINPFYSGWAAGFSITKEHGDMIRGWLGEGKDVKLLAEVDTSFEDGSLSLPTGVIPGREPEEVVLTAHLFEQGAEDNASGCAACLEIMGTITRMIAEGLLPVPRRTIRLLPVFETRSAQAWISSRPDYKPVAALAVDELGASKDLTLSYFSSPLSNPSAADYLLSYLLGNLVEPAGKPVRQMPFFINDNQWADPALGIAGLTVACTDERKHYYHNSLDTPEHVHEDTLQIESVMAASFIYFLANADDDDLKWLAHLVFQGIEEECDNGSVEGRKIFVGLQEVTVPGSCGVTRFRLGRIKDSILSLSEPCNRPAMRDYLDSLFSEIELSDGADVPDLDPELRREAEGLVPARHYRGFIAFDDLSPDQLADYRESFGAYPWWISATWLNEAMFLVDGTRSVYDIYRILGAEGLQLDVRAFLDYLRLAEATGKVSCEGIER